MKKVILFVFCITFFNCSQAQMTNGSFEYWETLTTVPEPEGWGSTNSFANYFGLQISVVDSTSDAQNGDWAVMLKTDLSVDSLTGMLWLGEMGMGEEGSFIGVPFTGEPTYLNGYYKCSVASGDTALGIMMLFNGINMVGFASYGFVDTVSTYTSFSMPVYYLDTIAPDTMFLFFSATNPDMPNEDSYLILDNLSLTGTSDTLPNGDFEVWNSKSYDEPEGWLTSNPFTLFSDSISVTQSSGDDGNYSVRIETRETMWGERISFIGNGEMGEDGLVGGYEFTDIPVSLSGSYKYSPVSDDTAMAWVVITNSDEDTLLEYGYYLPEVDSFTTFKVNTSELVDSTFMDSGETYTVLIAFASSFIPDEEDSLKEGHIGSVLFIDNLELAMPLGIVELDPNSNVYVYPNPMQNILNIGLNKSHSQDLSIYITDINGKVVYNNNLPLGKKLITINTETLPSGMYVLYMQDESKIVYSKKLVR